MEEKDNVLCPSRSTTRHTPLSPVSWLSRLGFKWRLVPSRLSAKPTSKSGTWGQRFKSQCGVATTRKPQVCNYRIAEVMMHIYIDQFCCQCFLFMEAIKLRLSIEPSHYWAWGLFDKPSNAVGNLGPGSLFYGTARFSVKHGLQDWMDRPGRSSVSQPQPFILHITHQEFDLY